MSRPHPAALRVLVGIAALLTCIALAVALHNG